MLSRFEELQLIAKCIAGDSRRAFERLVEEYQEGLRRFLLNLTLGDAALTDDLAQETFLKAYMSLRSFKGIARFKTWLYRIAYNEFYSYQRRIREVSVDDDGVPIVEECVTPISATDAHLDIEMCLKSLNENERTVVLLFYLEDQPIKKISEITGMPDGTIKSHISRAKQKMTKILMNDERR